MLVRSAASAILLCLLAATPAATAPRDRDRDRMPDRWERKYKLKKARADADRDGLTNLAEYRAGTHPRRRDTDGDRLRDGDERRFGWNPRTRDGDRDGLLDGQENAGVVTQVEGTRVTITLAVGGRLTGGIEDPAALSCVAPAQAVAETAEPGPGGPGEAVLEEPDWQPEWGPRPADPDADDNDDADAPPPLATAAQLPDDPDAGESAPDPDPDPPEPVAVTPPECRAQLQIGALVHEASSDLGKSGRRFTVLRLVTRAR